MALDYSNLYKNKNAIKIDEDSDIDYSTFSIAKKDTIPTKTNDELVVGSKEGQAKALEDFNKKQSVFSGLKESLTSFDSKDLPFYGTGKEAVENINVVLASDKYKKGKATDKDIEVLSKYYKEQEEEAKKRTNIGYAAGETIKGSARFMLELFPSVLAEIFTGGIAPTAVDVAIIKQATKVGAKSTLKRMATDKVYKQILTNSFKNVAKKEAKLLATQFVTTAPTNVTLGAAQRMIGHIDLESGEVIDEGQNIKEAIVNATTGHAVELITERGGGFIIGSIFKGLTKPVKNVITKTAIFNSLQKSFNNATNQQIYSLLKRTGWNGIIGEWFEERDADALNHALYSVGLGDQEFTGLTKEQIATEMLAFSIMGGGASIISNKNIDKAIVEAAKDKRGSITLPNGKQQRSLDDILGKSKIETVESVIGIEEVEGIPENQSLIEEVKKYNTVEELLVEKDIENNLSNVYNQLYGKQKYTTQPSERIGIAQREGLQEIGQEGEIRDSKEDTTPNISKLTEIIKNNTEGFTVNLNGEMLSSGFAVSPYKSRELALNPEEITDANVEKYIYDNFDLFIDKENNFGGWYNKADGKFYLDVSVVKDTLDEALEIAANNKQIAFYDMNQGKEVVTADVLKEKLTEVYNKAKIMQEKVGTEDVIKIEGDTSLFVRKKESTLLKEKIKAINQGIRKGVVLTKKEIRNTQTEIIKLLNDSKLENNDKAKFIATIKNTQTSEQLKKALPKIQSKIEMLETKGTEGTKNKLISDIRRNLQTFKTKNGQVGKTTVEYEMLREAMKTIYFEKNKLRTGAENILLLEEIEQKLADKGTESAVDFQDFVLQALLSEDTKGLGEMNIGELETLLIRIQQTKKIARDSFLWKRLERISKLKEHVNTSIEKIAPKNADDIFSNKTKVTDYIKRKYSELDIRDRGFAQIINFLDSFDGGKYFINTLYQPISESNKKFFVREDIRDTMDKNFLQTIFGKKDIFLDSKLKKMNKQKFIGRFVDGKDNDISLFLTDFEMIDIYNSFKMEENRRAMMEYGIYMQNKFAKGKTVYITQEMIDSIKNTMSPESKKIADYIISQVSDKEFLKEMSDAYEAKYNKPFPFVDGYWGMPRRYTGSNKKIVDLFHQEQSKRGIPSPSSFKERVKNTNPLLIQNGWNKYKNWWNDVARFIDYDKALEDIKAIITNKDFKSEFISTLGNKNYKQLTESFDWTASGGLTTVNVGGMGKAVNVLQRLLTINYIGGKSRNLISQGTSGIAAMADIPVKDFIEGTKDIMLHPKKAYYKMMESSLIRYRHKKTNFSTGMFLQESANMKQYTKLNPAEMSMIYTKVGDMTGVITAGYIVYKYNYKKYIEQKMDETLADKHALQDAENFVIATQQSALPEFANSIKRSHPVLRSIGRFQQAQAMYRASASDKIRTWLNKDDAKWERKNFIPMAKAVITYHFTLPAMYELSRGNINPLSIAPKVLLSPISGFMGWGKFVEYGIMVAFIKMLVPIIGIDDDDAENMLPFKPDIIFGEALKIYNKTVKSFGDWFEGKDDEDDFWNMLEGSLALLKIPIKNLREDYLKIEDILNGDNPLRLLETEWQSEQRKKSTSSRKSLDDIFGSRSSIGSISSSGSSGSRKSLDDIFK